MDRPPPTIFSRSRASAKWERARSRYRSGDTGVPFLLKDITDDMSERLQFMRPEPGKALVIGDWANGLTSHLATAGWAVSAMGLDEFDIERPFGIQAYDLIVHLIGLGHINDLPGALLHSRAALSDNGLFISAFPGAGSLTALRQIALAADGDKPSPRCHPLIDSSGAAGLMQRAGFKRQVVDSHRISARYSDLQKLIADLRDHGLTNALERGEPAMHRSNLALAQREFERLSDSDGKLVETFEILTLTGWK